MAGASEAGKGGPRLVVRNTFLEFFDDTVDGEASPWAGAGGPRRPRAQTDMTGTKMPRKVSYHVADETGYASIAEGGQSPHDCFGFGAISEGGPGFPGFGMPGDMAMSNAMMSQLGPLGPGCLQMPFGGLPMPGAWPYVFPGGPGSPYPPMPGPWGYPPMPYPPVPDAASAAAWQEMEMSSRAAAGARQQGQFKKGGKGSKADQHYGKVGGQQPRGSSGPSVGKGTAAAGKAKGGWDVAAVQTPPTTTPFIFQEWAAGIGRTTAEFVAQRVPKPRLNQAATQCLPTPLNASTVMLRNIPNKYSQELLLQLLDRNGFNCRYDFVYLPIDFRHGVNLGYAFVNLISHEDALALTETFQGYALWSCDSAKVCEVSWAHPHQGLAEHVDRYRNSPVMHPSTPEDYKPMLFENGLRIPFPPPTKAVRPPKVKGQGSGPHHDPDE